MLRDQHSQERRPLHIGLSSQDGRQATARAVALDSSAAGKPGIAPLSISLRKGGDAIRGTGEKIAANPVTDTGSVTVTIATSPVRSGLGPQLSFSCDSDAGNGPFGFGWSLSVPNIAQKTDKGLPRDWDYKQSDESIQSGIYNLLNTCAVPAARGVANRQLQTKYRESGSSSG